MEFLPLRINEKKVYAGFADRLLAGVVDFLVFVPLMVANYYVTSLSLTAAMACALVNSLAFVIYTIYFHNRYGATLGKMALGIKVTFPDGSKIGFRQALLRSSVDIFFAIAMMLAHIIAISKADPELFLNTGFTERTDYLIPLYPAWNTLVFMSSAAWVYSEFFVLLFNKRKRAIHDFIAGTVVIQKEYTDQVAELDTGAAIPPEVS